MNSFLQLLELCQQPGYNADEYYAIVKKHYGIDDTSMAPLCRECLCPDVLNDNRICPRCIRDLDKPVKLTVSYPFTGAIRLSDLE